MENKLRMGLQPFWFWNGDMRKEEIVRQIGEMKEKGVPGFLIHPRQGMEVPYMSREFFDRVKIAVRTAKENGMEVWLYDEYPYPSGICGGEVTLEHPEFLSRRLEKKIETVEGGREIRLSAPWGKVLLARAYPVKDAQGKVNLEDYVDLRDYVGTGYRQEVFQQSGLTQYNKKRYFTGDPVKLLLWNAPEGLWRIYLVTEAVTKHFKYFENFIDTMNPEAIRYFIQLTHERYKKEIGEEFGRTVKGIFSDEITAFPDSQPWSPLLPGEVKKRHGVDLLSSLPALWEELGETSSRVRYAYWSTATDCFIEAYDRQIQGWCRENGLLYIGEKPILRSKQLQYFDIPGIDTGHQKAGSPAKLISGKYRANGKMASSAAHFYDKPAALCEVGHSVGWGMTMQDLRWMIDWIGVQGISFFVIHGFFYTTDSLKKHDAPPSAFYQMPWWEDASVLTAHVSELSRFLQSTKRRVKLLIVDPVTSAWTSDRSMKGRLQEDFAKLQNTLLCRGLDFYIIDPELFAEGEVICEGEKTGFCVHGERYEAVILPPVRNLEREAGGKMLEFARKGGKVCGLAAIPFEEIQEGGNVREFETVFGIDAGQRWTAYSREEILDSVENGGCFLAGTAEDAAAWLSAQAPAEWEVLDRDGLGRDTLPMLCGTGEDGQERLFLVNTSDKPRKLDIKCPSGRVRTLELAEYESRIIMDGQEEKPAYLELDIDGEAKFSLSNLNALRLGYWELALPDGQRATVEAAPLIDQLEAGGLSLPVLQKKYFGCPKELDFAGTEVVCRTEIFCTEEILKGKPVYLVMEPGTFLGEWELQVNGHALGEKDFTAKKIYLDTNLAAEVGGYLVPGRNEIMAKVKVEVFFGGMRNPLYLFGEFGVAKRGEDWELSALPAMAKLGDFCGSGLPFYYGEAVFEEELWVDEVTEKEIIVRLKAEWLADSVRLAVGDYETAPCAWQPYLFRIPAGYLRKGKNTVKLKVRNTAIGLFEGQVFNRERHGYEEV